MGEKSGGVTGNEISGTRKVLCFWVMDGKADTQRVMGTSGGCSVSDRQWTMACMCRWQ